MDCSVIVLAAGFSGRMGIPKFALKFDENRTFLEEIVEQYNMFGCQEMVIVLNEEGKKLYDELNIPFAQNVKIVINHHPEYERFYSIKTGLKNLKSERKKFIHNVDNPFVSQGVLKILFNSISDADYCFPVCKGRGGHPVLLSESVVKDITEFKDSSITLRDFLKAYSGNRVEVNYEKVLVNINTMDEYLLISR